MKKNIKNKGFLLIITSTLILAILSSFLIGYRIILRKGAKIQSFHEKNIFSEIKQNLETLIYDEIYKIDKLVSNGYYKSHVEYVSITENNRPVWQETSLKNTKNGFLLEKINFHNAKIYKERASINILKLMKENLTNKNDNTIRIFEITLSKKIKKLSTSEAFNIKAILRLEYNFKNNDIFNPDKEILKEYVISFDK